MKIIALVLSLLIYTLAYNQEHYTININDSSFKISLDKNYEVIIGGKKIKILVSANDTLDFIDDLVSFKYTKNFNLSSTKLDVGIEQLMLVTAEGSGVIIQRYSSIDPTSLNELFLREVTKESVNYGFNMTRADYNLKLSSGENIKVDKAILKYKDETNIYEITTIGKKDEGVLIMTMKMDDEKDNQGQKLINLMWKTLIIK